MSARGVGGAAARQHGSRTGGCCCGALRFRVEGEPRRVGVCHCLDCRKIHGAPFMSFAVFDAAQVAITGEARRFNTQPGYARGFCPECGSHVFAEDEGGIELYHGGFDEPDLLPPSYELWTVRRESWLELPSVTEHHAGNRQRPTA